MARPFTSLVFGGSWYGYIILQYIYVDPLKNHPHVGERQDAIHQDLPFVGFGTLRITSVRPVALDIDTIRHLKRKVVRTSLRPARRGTLSGAAAERAAAPRALPGVLFRSTGSPGQRVWWAEEGSLRFLTAKGAKGCEHCRKTIITSKPQEKNMEQLWVYRRVNSKDLPARILSLGA